MKWKVEWNIFLRKLGRLKRTIYLWKLLQFNFFRNELFALVVCYWNEFLWAIAVKFRYFSHFLLQRWLVFSKHSSSLAVLLHSFSISVSFSFPLLSFLRIIHWRIFCAASWFCSFIPDLNELFRGFWLTLLD